MRIVIAPDKFAGTLSAMEAARAIAEGWASADPGSECDLVPLSDGGPGFVEVMGAALGGQKVAVEVAGPLRERLRAEYLLVGGGASEATAYIESAQACGLHLVPSPRRDPARTTTFGVGMLIADAIDRGAETVVVGLGGSATNDAGAGMLAALASEDAGISALAGGGGALADPAEGVQQVLAQARRRTGGIRLVAATDVDNPLLGEHGASAVFGPQKGADAGVVRRLDAALAAFAEATDPGELHAAPGAGAAGGLGYGLLLLGAIVESGVGRALAAVDLNSRVAKADLVITGEGSFDAQSLRGKLPHGVARAAAERAVPCVVLAGQVSVDAREAAESGITAAYSLAESAGLERALAQPGRELRDLAAAAAREHAHGGE